MSASLKSLVPLILATPLLASASPPQTASSAPVRIEVLSREAAYGGQTFGAVGSYEKIVAVAHLRIDPDAPANRGIVDLDKAPRAADGMVDYDVDVVLLRPAEAKRARPVMLFEVVNRGMKLTGMLNGGTLGEQGDPLPVGDGLLMRRGLTVAWVGWQGDVNAKGLIGARFPVAQGKDGPLTGPVSTETIFDAPPSRLKLPYAAASLDQAAARLSVRERTADPLETIPEGDWQYDDATHVSFTPPPEMDKGAVYRFEYTARDPVVMGLGFASVRDTISFLRHGTGAQGNPLADLAAAPCEHGARSACRKRHGDAFSSVVAIGGSQSARYLRDYLWQGFNRDLSGRKVFDGMIPFIAGGRKTFTNFRFAEPGRFSRQHEDHEVPGFDFPFTYATLKDPVTGNTDGLMASCTRTATCPLVFHIDTSAEFWQAGASLVGMGGTWHDIDFPPNVRAYMITGGPHAPGYTLPWCRQSANPLNYAPVLRALTVDMIDWTEGGKAPPESVWPKLARGELAPIKGIAGPNVPDLGLVWPQVVNEPQPGENGRVWPILVPAIDSDGNDAPGIRLPRIAAPDGTYLGWSTRKAGYAEGDLCLIFGGFAPFAPDAVARGADPRPSLAERYKPGERAARMEAAANALVQARLLLPEDARAASKEAASAR